MKQKGFTLIEMVISISILSVALVGVYNAFSIVTILTSDSADRLTGTYLAQEGLEIVRNIRDTNWLNINACAADINCTPGSYTWVDNLTSAGVNPSLDCSTANGCEADYTTAYAGGIQIGSGRHLSTNVSGFYNYTGGPSSKFERKITITPITDVDGKSDHIIKVKVDVSWDEKSTILSPGFLANTCSVGNNCITAQATLYNWY